MFTFSNHTIANSVIGLKLGLVAVIAFLLAGCAVLQKPGTGRQLVLKEPQTNRTYYLYLPAGYDPSKRWPVVVTLHGRNPFDTAHRQIREWQNTADKYGLIVVAPALSNSNKLIPGVNLLNTSVRQDERVLMNIMDHVLGRTAADPNRVLVTAWSNGGTVMHYVANQHPDRFAALCARGCWFKADMLDEDNARRMAERNFPVMIFYGQGDSWNIKMDSNSAIKWYKSMGFNVESTVIPQSLWMLKSALAGLGGHDRHPEPAAEFFMRVTGSPSQKVAVEPSKL